jgi:hypothetical protein
MMDEESKTICSQSEEEEEGKILTFKEQKEKFDKELDEIENRLNRNIKKNKVYLESTKKTTDASEPKKDREFLTRLQYLEKRLEREIKESNIKSKSERKEEFMTNISQMN